MKRRKLKLMKYNVYVAQYFDTYFEWKKLFGTVDTLKEAKELKIKALKQYRNRPLVSYSIYIEENKDKF